MDEQVKLLTKLLAFYKKRYDGKELEDKFTAACDDLMSSNDLKRAIYIKFCIENDVEPKIPKKVRPRPSSSSDDGCGHGGRATRGC